MKKNDLRIADYLDHMLEAIGRIERYTRGMTSDAFAAESLVQDAPIRNLEIIGEAARNVERHHANFAARHADVPWEDMYLMRNRISHGYFSVDPAVVWQTIVRDLPVLKEQIARIREQTP
ncbi:DUF86 domain-containing protein [Paraburkholderia sabiae]|uniref:DUF86 domain-containing protein n=1 Tax=Paraburkholderia sabiae TaxID=273251 RepID=A0ABU9QQ75_9BURK|nr:DUF86 domain-containing protein [Paraburkholderia sabiae]WJZ73312.1 DUF86 domain-containing protein [Paraburkholderia sabiae]CAD6553553.1 hypothetical protein LMG24235_05277 [Paraburkholderia sabiae]